jgi:NAD(P)-dependent dehydrogenase (short-subunit alcohol dehydrogenase family)
VLCAGAFPPAAPLHEQSWEQFAINWETDVKMAFHFCNVALSLPLRAGASVVLISSGAALAGSANSGGYAGAKRMQIFIANYSRKESDRLGLGLRFTALAPRMMPDSELGKHAVAGYSRYLGISAADFIQSMDFAADCIRCRDRGHRIGHEPGSLSGKCVHRLWTGARRPYPDASELRSGGPILRSGIEAIGINGTPLPRIVIGDPRRLRDMQR